MSRIQKIPYGLTIRVSLPPEFHSILFVLTHWDVILLSSIVHTHPFQALNKDRNSLSNKIGLMSLPEIPLLFGLPRQP